MGGSRQPHENVPCPKLGKVKYSISAPAAEPASAPAPAPTPAPPAAAVAMAGV